MIFQPEQFETSSLVSFPHGKEICQILASALNSADAGVGIRNKVSLDISNLMIGDTIHDLTKYKRVYIIAAGKAAVPMSAAMSEILGNHLTYGVVITKDGYVDTNKSVFENCLTIIEACHPIPDRRNLEASTQVISLSKNLDRDDLVICLLSGGGSSLLMKPSPGLSLNDIQDTTSLLLICGASIYEINTIRKHLDIFKGGGLGKLLFPATVISLLLSDVVGDSLDMIASGPTVSDSTTYQDAWDVLDKHYILSQVPPQVLTHLADGKAGRVPETKNPGDPALAKIQNVMVGSNEQAASAAVQAANNLGFSASLLSTTLQGEASQVGQAIAEKAKGLLSSPVNTDQTTCLIAGGETIVTIKGAGKGGRNQELSLGAVKSLSGANPISLISLATDGGDGPTDAAGAVVTNHTYSLGLSKGMNPAEYLEQNDSYHYFEPLGDLIKTGPTLTNVNDLVFIFSG